MSKDNKKNQEADKFKEDNKNKGDDSMYAVLKLDDYKIDTRTSYVKKKKVNDEAKFFNDNIDDIVELELNNTGIDEFLNKFVKKKE